MTEEFNLSKKRNHSEFDKGWYWEKDIKEFIKEIIKDIEGEELLNRFKKRAGDKLI